MSHYVWCNTQWPAKVDARKGQIITVYGQIFVEGLTTDPQKIPQEEIEAELLYGPENTHPLTEKHLWKSVRAEFVGHRGPENHNYEFCANIYAEDFGRFWYVFRYTLKQTGEQFWGYVDNAHSATPVLGLVKVSNTLRVASLHLAELQLTLSEHEYLAPLESGLEHIASEIVENEIDIVALQGLRINSADNYPLVKLLQFIEQFSMEKWFSFYAEHQWNAAQYREGIAIISRIPMNPVDVIELPHIPDTLTRKLLLSTFSSSLGTVCVGSTQLSNEETARGENLRCQQMFALRRALASQGNDVVATILCGEFPINTHSPAFRVATDPDAEGVRLFDALAHFDPAPTYPTWNPRHRVDYIFVTATSKLSVTYGKRFLQNLHHGRYVTAHTGIYCEFSANS